MCGKTGKVLTALVFSFRIINNTVFLCILSLLWKKSPLLEHIYMLMYMLWYERFEKARIFSTTVRIVKDFMMPLETLKYPSAHCIGCQGKIDMKKNKSWLKLKLVGCGKVFKLSNQFITWYGSSITFISNPLTRFK